MPWVEIVPLGGNTRFRVIAELEDWPIEAADVDESCEGRVAITLYEHIRPPTSKAVAFGATLGCRTTSTSP